MDLGIAGRVALITGAGRGLGKADCLRLAEEGCKVAAIDILGPEVEETAEELRQKGGQALGLKCDITDRAAVKEMAARVQAELGSVDIVVNNAAIVTTVGRFAVIADEQWDRDLAVNLTGAWNVTRCFWAGMIERQWGRIICMASIAGMMGGFGQASYSTTKMGIVGFAKTLALEGARYGITSNVVVPGIIDTEVFRLGRPDMIERMRMRVAMRREGKPEEVADAVAFLCSERAKYITGITLHVMGGMDLFTF